MTAEVGVLNRLGVALAADSAVSIGREANKIWTSADKLFHLSQSAPVGLMVYGNANFIGIPWETVVKEFRRELAGSRFDRLDRAVCRAILQLPWQQSNALPCAVARPDGFGAHQEPLPSSQA